MPIPKLLHHLHLYKNLSCEGSSHTFIYGGNVNFSNSGINAEISGEKTEKTNIDIYADNLMFKNSSFIDAASAISAGIGGDININVAGNFIMSGLHPRSKPFVKETKKLNNNWIFASAFDEGKGGNINIEANEMTLLDGSQIDISVLGNGDASDSVLTIKVKDVLTVAGQHPTNIVVVSLIGSFSENLKPGASGNSGFIDVEARKVVLLDGGGILAITTGFGNAGNVRIKVYEDLIIAGNMQVIDDPFKDSEVELLPWSTGIQAGSTPLYVRGQGQGQPGNVEVEAENIILKDGG